MYNRELETNSEKMKQHNENLKRTASERLAKVAKKKKDAKKDKASEQ